MKKLRLGLVGLGRAGYGMHLPELKGKEDMFEIYAVCDIEADRCENMAKEYGCIFVDFQQMFEDYCKIRHSSYLAWDRVHPNQIGATLMAKEFLSHCGYKY